MVELGEFSFLLCPVSYRWCVCADIMTSTSGSPSTATDHLAHVRRSKKPLLEKKRRARINKSLEQLKALVLEALKKDTARYSKLEKADILEMTVKHLRDTQRHQLAVAMSVDPTVVGKFRSGYTECAQEVGRYLGTIDGLSGQTRDRLLQHLSRCSSNPEHVISYYTPGMSAAVPGLLATPVGHLPGYSGAGLGVSVPDNGYYGNLYGYQTFPREYPSPVNSEADSSFERSHSRASSRCSSPGGSTEPKISLVGDYSEHFEARDNKLLSAQKAEFDNHRGSRDSLHAANQTIKIERKDFSASSLVCESQRLNNQVDSRKNNGGNFNIEVKQEPVWRPW